MGLSSLCSNSWDIADKEGVDTALQYYDKHYP
jgi:hypothetical protein